MARAKHRLTGRRCMGLAALHASAAVLCTCPLTTLGCVTRRPALESMNSPTHAQALVVRANTLLTTNPARAEALLRDAVFADPYNGQARNNLGVSLLARGELSEAAQAFDDARRLLPTSPDPRINLGMTYERAGRTTEALECYTTALEVAPEHIPAMQSLARLQLRSGRRTADTARLLRAISLHGTDEAWRSWGRMQLAKLSEHP